MLSWGENKETTGPTFDCFSIVKPTRCTISKIYFILE